MKKIVILGYYGFGNTGDEAILDGIIQLFRDNFSNVEILILTKEPDQTSKRLNVNCHYHAFGLTNYLSNPYLRTRALLHVLSSDLLIIGGGGLYHDYWNTLPFGLIELLLRKLILKPTIIYSVGVGPYNHNISCYMASLFFKCVNRICVRDKESYALLASMGLKNVNIGPDPATYLRKATNVDVKSLEIFRKINLGKFFVISLRNWYNSEMEYCLADLLNNLIKETNLDVLFIPFYEDDLKAINAISRRLDIPDNYAILNGTYSPEELISIMSYSSFTIGMRLHSLILSFCAGVPFFGISYDPKVRSFCKEIYGDQTENYIELKCICSDLGHNRVGTFINELDSNTAIIKQKIFIFRNLFKDNLKLIKNFL